jgi:import inner membrane translocase subunit TIM44
VRSGVRATGRGIEKVTRPVRETNVYKTTVGGVKEVIDDGSSSRYGGWIEKEERRKQRERELNDATVAGRAGKGGDKVEEDPKSVCTYSVYLDAFPC